MLRLSTILFLSAIRYQIVQGQTVTDVTPPVIIGCPNTVRVTKPAGSIAVSATWTEPRATDNSGVTPMLQSRSHTPDSVFPLGVTTVTYIFIDGSGNIDACAFPIIVAGSRESIVISNCPNDMNVIAPQGILYYQGDWVAPSAVDNSGRDVSVMASDIPPRYFNVPSVNRITYTFTNDAGDQQVCTFTFNIATSGDTPPVIRNCPSDLQVTAVSGSATVVWTEPSATDDSGVPPTRSRSHTPGSVFNVGTTVVTYRFTDGSSNTATCTFNVIVLSSGDTPPVIRNCPSDRQVTTVTGSATVVWTEPSATVDSGVPPTRSRSHTPGSVFNVGTTVVTYRFTDGSSNTASCTFNVIVLLSGDTTAPVISNCPNTGTGSVTVGWAEPSATDDSGVAPTRSRSHTPGSDFNFGTTVVTYRFTDGSSNTATCTFNVFVLLSEDTTPPVIRNCPSDRQRTIGTSGGAANVVWTEPSATDDSDVLPTLNRSHTPGSEFNVGTTVVTYTFTDGSDNTATCTFSIVVLYDNRPPQFQQPCPGIRTEYILSPCENEMIVTFELPTPIDESEPVTVVPNPFAEILNVETVHEVVFTAWDAFDNSAQCTVSINVQGFDCGDPPPAPEFGYIASQNCTDVMYQCDAGYRLVGESRRRCEDDAKWNQLEVEAACEEILCDALAEPSNGLITCQSYTPHRVGTQCCLLCDNGYKFSGNTACVDCLQDGSIGQWSQDLTNAACQDNTAPDIACPRSFDVTLPEGANNTSVSWRLPTATSSAGQSVPVFHNESSGLTPPIDLPYGKHVMVYFAQNVVGQKAYCQFTINVIDTEPPTAGLCPDGLIVIEVVSSALPVFFSWIRPYFTDNVGVTEITNDTDITERFFLSYSWEPQIITYTAKDAAGNSAQCGYIFRASNASACNCPTLENNPPNAILQCDTTDCKSCRIVCSDGTVALTRTSPEANCTKQGVGSGKRTNMDKEGVPIGKNPFENPQGCATVESNFPIDAAVSRDIVFEGPSVCDKDRAESIQNDIQIRLQNTIQPICNENESTCSAIVTTKCNPSSRRRRRQTDTNKQLLVDVKVRVVRSDSIDTSVPEQVLALDVLDIIYGISNQSGELSIVSAKSGPIETNCNASQDAAGVRCVRCPFGTSYNLKVKGCLPCQIGEYQDQEGQLICKKCQDGKSTLGSGSYSAEACQDACLPGHYSYSGLQPNCRPCPKGTYQPASGQRECISCSKSLTTDTGVATLESDCIEPDDDIAPICSPVTDIIVSVNPEEVGRVVNFQEPAATDNSGAVVLEVKTHESPSFFPLGTTPVCYSFADPSGNKVGCCFDVSITKALTDPCSSSPCMNGAQCLTFANQQGVANYFCRCVNGFTGNRCENPEAPITTPCTPTNPCFNGGVCTVRGNSFTCSCPTGFGGFTCQNDVAAPNVSNCPRSVTLRTASVTDTSADAIILMPTATDNSGEVFFAYTTNQGESIRVSLDGTEPDQQGRIRLQASFPVGQNIVTVIASDISGNQNNRCRFFVTVIQI